MFLENIKLVRPDVFDLASSVDQEKLSSYYNEIAVLTDISDKNYDKDITSPYIELIKSTFFYDYFVEKYNVSDKIWLDFILDINKIVSKLDTQPLETLKILIEKKSIDFFSKIIDKSMTFDKEFVEKCEIEIKDWTTDLELVDTLFNQITFKIMEDNINTKALIIEIIIDWITNWETVEEVIFRISNLNENYG